MENPESIQMPGRLAIKPGAQANMMQRYNLAVRHMIAAALFARHCYKVEEENKGSQLGPFFEEISSYASASVILAVAALEAHINEILADVGEESIEIDNLKLKNSTIPWKEVKRYSALNKCSYFCEIRGVSKKFDKEKDEYKLVELLIDLRNRLIHYYPEWHELDSSAEQNIQWKKSGRININKEISEKLKGKFRFSPFFKDPSPIFPDRCMSHSCADWAVRSSLDFIKWFANIAGIETPFAKPEFADRFKTTPE